MVARTLVYLYLLFFVDPCQRTARCKNRGVVADHRKVPELRFSGRDGSDAKETVSAKETKMEGTKKTSIQYSLSRISRSSEKWVQNKSARFSEHVLPYSHMQVMR